MIKAIGNMIGLILDKKECLGHSLLFYTKLFLFRLFMKYFYISIFLYSSSLSSLFLRTTNKLAPITAPVIKPIIVVDRFNLVGSD